MASVTASSVKFSPASSLIKQNQFSNLKKASVSFTGNGFQSHRLPVRRFRIACAAKPETVNKVVDIVRKQLALPDDRDVCGESKFSVLGADSLDTGYSTYLSTSLHMDTLFSVPGKKNSLLAIVCEVEIVMGLEEEFGICVEEESAQSISTVQEAADLIEELLEKK
ncbi:hypothetical protein SASPL_100365 [Salvia splendens]|uniref:Acyl carrier protein n=1 Tax=Salvia splendens TaxID=180675 RepID=A0A8X9ACE3_SALSN|nr:hypothetical protein SASPL_100365 [Salvia splendens]